MIINKLVSIRFILCHKINKKPRDTCIHYELLVIYYYVISIKSKLLAIILGSCLVCMIIRRLGRFITRDSVNKKP